MTDINRQLSARGAAYELLARLYLEPPDAELAAALRELPGFAEHVAAPADQREWLDDLAVEHERLFGLNVFPYESIYRDRDLMLNTAAAERVAALYQECGFDGSRSPSGAPDHLGLELRLMSELVALEARADARGDRAAVRWSQARQARCLHQHLAQWAPICAQTVARVAAQPLYQALASLTTELVLTDLAALPWREPTPSPLEQHPPQHDTAAADERGLSALVRQLLTPDSVGVLLTRADIGGLGRALGLPAPPGDRVQMLRGLFEAAGQFEQAPALLDALDQIFVRAAQAVATLMLDYPAWAVYGAPWRDRIAGGRALLVELRAQASGLDHEKSHYS